VRREGDAHRAFVHGRCDGLGRVLGSFDVWVLIRAEGDQSLWVQHPAAVIDPTAGTWQASVLFGDRRHRPYDGQRWTILAAAAPPSSGFNRLTNAPSQTGLPPHVASNVATVRVRVVGGASPGATTR
ncbi:MAG TPA: hypothetical protein VER32_04360, partial [Pyrinomonadaceae bacterium]|nr:hypothetical protein [Pyrinomonadaceae bacterium]